MPREMNALTCLAKLQPTLAFLLQGFSDCEHWAGCSTGEKDDVTHKTELLVDTFIWNGHFYLQYKQPCSPPPPTPPKKSLLYTYKDALLLIFTSIVFPGFSLLNCADFKHLKAFTAWLMKGVLGKLD